MPVRKRSFRPPTLIDAVNRFPERPVPPYFVIPSYWRRFVFQVLSAREWALYCYMCSVANPEGVAFPLRSQVMEDCGLKSKEVVSSALGRLEEAGFLLHRFRPISPNATAKRHFYQRPALQFTLLTLLNRGEIDADLFPTKPGSTRAPSATSEGAVLNGLANIVDDDDAVQQYADEENGEKKLALLVRMLSKSHTPS